jgi:predicted acyltransferase
MSMDKACLVKERILSIDALRGFDMFWLIGGNELGRSVFQVYNHPVAEAISNQFNHSQWHGFHLEDFIFPLFLFIVGLVLPFSMARHLQTNAKPVYLHLLKRTTILFVLGMLAGGLLLKFEVRWVGVLQRIAVCYFIAAILFLHTGWRTQAFIAGGILLASWPIMTMLNMPGYDCIYLDKDFLKAVPKIAETGIWIMSVPSTLLGVLAGHWLRSNNSDNRKSFCLAAGGVIFILIAFAFDRAGYLIVFRAWTGSFVMLTAGLSMVLLAIFYWIIDVKGYRKWAAFFVVIGTNAILAYWLRRSSIIDFQSIANFFVLGFATRCGIFEPMILAIGFTAVQWLLLYFLYRHKIFLKA